MHGPARPGGCGGDAIAIFLLRATQHFQHMKLVMPPVKSLQHRTRLRDPCIHPRRPDEATTYPRTLCWVAAEARIFSPFSRLKCLAFSRAEKAVDRSGAELLAFHWKNRKKNEL